MDHALGAAYNVSRREGLPPWWDIDPRRVVVLSRREPDDPAAPIDKQSAHRQAVESDRWADPGKEPESMRRLPRRLALWGGAAAIASGGFAFMASNAVPVTSAGEGANAVTGYKVTNITYTTVPMGYAGSGRPATAEYMTAVTFTLTGQNQPTQVIVYAKTVKGTGRLGPFVPLHTGYNVGHQPKTQTTLGSYQAQGCTLVGSWTAATGPTNGHGQYKCTWHFATAPPEATVGGLDVSASQ